MLPLTLITGVYGMNIETLPFGDSAGVFSFVFSLILMAMVAVGRLLAWFRHKRWL